MLTHNALDTTDNSSYSHVTDNESEGDTMAAKKLNPIEIAVAPLRTDAIERAEQDALAYIERARADLEANGWDINKAAPYPFSFGGGIERYMAVYKHNNYHAITEQDPKLRYQSSNGKTPVYVVMSEKRSANFIQARKDQAALEYDAFVAKLIKKIGPVVSAELDGNHVWAHSILTVILKGGETQRWKTQQITNISKYGKFFQQWPSRKIK